VKKKQQRLLHWQKITQHAAEQSGRTLVPQIKPIEEFEPWVEQQQGLRILLDPYAEICLPQITPPQQDRMTLLSGPEGGFSDRERQLAVSSGFIAVKMGSRILRTETAALAAISAIQTLWGDFRNS
jgi:16S rRNA (uracil1498-N3)-methyltransferase